MNKKYHSEILQVIHEDMKGMHELGIISDEKMREFDEGCLVQEPETVSPVKTEQLRHATALITQG